MASYDPAHGPNSADWLALDEGVRLELVRESLRRSGVHAKQLNAQAAVYVIVENQLAMGIKSACAAMVRLRRTGMDRTTALQHIGFVALTHINEQRRRPTPDSWAEYDARLAELAPPPFRDP